MNVKFEVSDFFSVGASGEIFDIVYDYTYAQPLFMAVKRDTELPRRFFVAIPPARRAEWGAQMKKLVKPGGYLITLIFPILGYTDSGPPFFVRPEHYDEVLGSEGWEKVLDKVPERSLPTHINKERLIVRKRV